MSKYDLSALQAMAQEEIDENEKKKQQKEGSGIPLVYPIENGTFRIKLLYNPKANAVQRKVVRHTVGKEKVPCMSIYGEECPICKAISSAEDEYGQECGAWSKYGYKVRGISLAVLVDYEKGMFSDKNSPNKGDIILFMYPPTLYDKINEIIVKAGDHIEDLVVNNTGKTIEITRKQKNGGFPEYSVSVYAYGDEKIKETDEEFDKLLEDLPNLNDQLMPSLPTEDVLNKVRAAAESIDTEFASGKVLNPNNPPQESIASVQEEVKNGGNISAEVTNDSNPSTDNDSKPECFGNHSDDAKCLVCPFECDCMLCD